MQTLYYVYKQKGIDLVKLFQTSTLLITIGGLGTYRVYTSYMFCES